MGYEELIENAKVCCGDIEVEDCIEHCKNPCDKRGEELRWCRQWLIHDLHTAITDLLARAEAAEATQETLQRAMAEYKARSEKLERELNWLLEEEEKVPFDPFGVTKEE